MKAFYVPAALLILLLLSSLWSGSYVQRYTQQWITELDEMTDLLQSERWDEVEERILSLHRDWDRRKTAFHMIMEHQDLDEAEKFFAGAAAACRERDRAELSIHLQQLRTQMLFLAETQQANIKNIL